MAASTRSPGGMWVALLPQPLPQWVHRVYTGADGKQYLRIANRLEEQI